MLKINPHTELIGVSICIRNSWRCKIAQILNKNEESFPFNFKIIDSLENSYLCESIPDNKSKKKVQIWVTSNVIHYLQGCEVEDCNVGLYFTDYLPLENSKLLIFNSKQNSITPVQFQLSVGMCENVPHLSFIFVNLLNNEIFDINSQQKNSWKNLNGSDAYMTDMEKMYQDTFVHKGYVLQVCEKFAKHLEGQGLHDDATALRERAKTHDNSKILNKDEFRALTNIINDKSCLGNASSQLSSFKQDSIELHWKHNPHHPEHYPKAEDMTRIDRLEMVCDWMARSIQYKSDLLSFVETRQRERFHFPELMYDEIFHYCKVLVSLFG